MPKKIKTKQCLKSFSLDRFKSFPSRSMSLHRCWPISLPAAVKHFKFSLSLWGFFFSLLRWKWAAAEQDCVILSSIPCTPYLPLTASNWNCDHIFHIVSQPRLFFLSLFLSLKSALASRQQWKKWLSPPCCSLFNAPSFFLSPPTPLPPPPPSESHQQPALTPCRSPPGSLQPCCLQPRRLVLVGSGRAHLLRVKKIKKTEWIWDWIRGRRRGGGWAD